MSNITTNYCSIHYDGSGCIDASVTNVCHDKKSVNNGHETCFHGRDYPECSGGTPPEQRDKKICSSISGNNIDCN